MSLGWFDCTEHSLTTSLQGKQGVQDAYALVRGGNHAMWWNGPTWLKHPQSEWPQQPSIPLAESSDEVRHICHHAVSQNGSSLIAFDRYSSFNHLKRITAWIFRFINNCRHQEHHQGISQCLTTEDLARVEEYWISLSQKDCFCQDIESLKNDSVIHKSSPLFALHPFMDSNGLVRVGGRLESRTPQDIPSFSTGNIQLRSS